MKPEQTCQSCRYFNRSRNPDHFLDTCRHSPPASDAGFPVTEPQWWCGKWRGEHNAKRTSRPPGRPVEFDRSRVKPLVFASLRDGEKTLIHIHRFVSDSVPLSTATLRQIMADMEKEGMVLKSLRGGLYVYRMAAVTDEEEP